MKRRELLSSVGASTSAGAVVLTGCLGDPEPVDDVDGGTDDTADADAADTAADTGDNAAPELPIEVETVDAPGSDAGTMTVPQSDRVLLVNFTRTLCPTSEAFLEPLGEARAILESEREEIELGGDGGVTFLSVTNGTSGPQPSPAELADWWVEHDGHWPVGIDRDGALNDYYDVSGFPTTVAIDGEGTVHWRRDRPTGATNVVSGIEDALEAESNGTTGSEPDADADTEQESNRAENGTGESNRTAEP